MTVKELNFKGGENRFKFSSFSEQLSLIDVDVFHSLNPNRKSGFVDHSSSSLSFRDYLQEWRDLNCTIKFATIYKSIQTKCGSLELLLLNARDIVSILCTGLSGDDFNADESIYSLLTCLARDLRSEFVEYASDVIRIVAARIKTTKEFILVEAAYKSLGFIVKYLWKDLVKCFGSILSATRPLLEDRNENIRFFAAPMLAFLLRKMDNNCLLDSVCLLLDVNNDENDAKRTLGPVYVFLELLKGPKHGLHSSHKIYLETIIKACVRNDYGRYLINTLFLKLFKQLSDENAITVLNYSVNAVLRNDLVEVALDIINQMGSNTGNSVSLLRMKCLRQICALEFDEKYSKTYASVYISIFKNTLPEMFKDAYEMFDLFLKRLPYNHISSLVIFLLLTKWIWCSEIIEPLLVSHIVHSDNKSSRLYVDLLVAVKICSFKKPQRGDRGMKGVVLDILHARRENISLSDISLCNFFIDTRIVDAIKQIQFDISVKPEVRFAASTLYIDHCSKEDKFYDIQNCLDSLTAELCSHKEEITLLQLLLKIIYSGFLIDENRLFYISNELMSNIKHPSSRVRMITLHIMDKMSQLLLNHKTNLFLIMLEIDELYEQDRASRMIVVKLSQLTKLHKDSMIMDGLKGNVIISYYLLSFLSRNYRPLWTPTISLLAELGSSNMCNIVYNEIQMISGTFDKDFEDFSAIGGYMLKNILSAKPDLKLKQELIEEVVALETGLLAQWLCRYWRFNFANSFEAIRFDKENYRRLLILVIKENVDKLPPDLIGKILTDLLNCCSFSTCKLIIHDYHGLEMYMDALQNCKKLKSLPLEKVTAYRQLLEQLMSSNHVRLQKFSVECYFALEPASENVLNCLRKVFEEKNLSDYLVNLKYILPNSSLTERERIMPFLLRLLYGQMKVKGSDAKLRSSISSFISSCADREICFFFDLLLEPFRKVDDCSCSELIGMLKNLRVILDHTASKIVSVCSQVIGVLQVICEYAQNKVECDDVDICRYREIRSTGLKRIVQIFAIADKYGYDLYDHMSLFRHRFVEDRIAHLAVENIESAAPILKLLHLVSYKKNLMIFLLRNDQTFVQEILKLLAIEKAKAEPMLLALDILLNIIPMWMEKDTFLSILDVETLVNALSRDSIATKDSRVFERKMDVLIEIAPLVKNNSDLKNFLKYISGFIRSKFKSKLSLLKMVGALFATFDNHEDVEELRKLFFPILCAQILHEKDHITQLELLSTLKMVDKGADVGLELAESLLSKPKSLREEVSEEQYQALKLMEDKELILNDKCWRPLLYTLLSLLVSTNDSIFRHSCSYKLISFLNSKGEENIDLVQNCLIPSLKSLVLKETSPCRVELVDILRICCHKFPELTFLKEFQVLDVCESSENNFFSEIYHIQIHRRIRCLKKFSALVSSRGFSPSILYSFFIPFFICMIKESDSNKHHQLVHDLIKLVGVCSSSLEANQYDSLLRKIVVDLRKLKDKLSIKLFSSIIENFNSISESENKRLTSTYINLSELIRSHKEDSPLKTQYFVELIVSTIKLLNHMHCEFIEEQFPSLLAKLCQKLRSYSLETRSVVRDALFEVITSTKSRFVPFVFKELVNALTEGYQLHVLTFTIGHLFAKVNEQNKAFDFETSGDIVMIAVLNDIFGKSAEHKQVQEATRKMPEMRKSRGFDIVQLLCSKAQNVSFIEKFFASVFTVELSNTINFYERFELFCKKIVDGICCNKDIDLDEYTSFCTRIIRSGGDIIKSTIIPHHLIYGSVKKNILGAGFDILYRALKRERIIFDNDKRSPCVDSVFDTVVDSMRSPDTTISTLSLKIINYIGAINPDLYLTEAIVQAVFSLLGRNGHGDSVSALLKLMQLIIDKKGIELTEKQVIFLAKLSADLLENCEFQAFTLLRLLVDKGFKQPEIYDLVEKVMDIAITSHCQNVQKSARSITVLFMKAYPLSSKKMQRYFGRFVGNLQYEHENGRKSALEFCHVFTDVFPSQIVNQYAEMLFLHLSIIISEDKSIQCRSLAKEVFLSLMRNINNAEISKINRIIMSWIEGTDCDVQRAGFNSLECLFEYGLNSQNSLIYDSNKVMERIKCTCSCTDGDDIHWKLKYSALCCMEKLLHLNRPLVNSINTDFFITLLNGVSHEWILIISSRILNEYLDNGTSVEMDKCYEICQLYVRKVNLFDFVSDELINLSVRVISRMANILQNHKESFFALFKSISIGARKLEQISHRKKLIYYQMMAGISNFVDSRTLMELLDFILMPILRTIDHCEKSQESDTIAVELSTFCLQFMKFIEEKVGAEVYLEHLKQVKQAMRDKREERRSQKKMLAVTNPQAAAKRKISQNLGKKNAKKRKIEEFKKWKMKG